MQKLHAVQNIKIWSRDNTGIIDFSLASGSNMAQLGIGLCVSFKFLFASSVEKGSTSTLEQTGWDVILAGPLTESTCGLLELGVPSSWYCRPEFPGLGEGGGRDTYEQ